LGIRALEYGLLETMPLTADPLRSA
jgi:hypothetical protein